jgi:cellulose synthase/poly-beta-1,6-N-acetylglucosamine synthase-like glycosyltransferase
MYKYRFIHSLAKHLAKMGTSGALKGHFEWPRFFNTHGYTAEIPWSSILTGFLFFHCINEVVISTYIVSNYFNYLYFLFHIGFLLVLPLFFSLRTWSTIIKGLNYWLIITFNVCSRYPLQTNIISFYEDCEKINESMKRL